MKLFKSKENTAVAVLDKREVAMPVSEDTITQYMRQFGLGMNLQDNELEAFKHMAVMHNLNPFNREIHCVAYGSGDYRTLSIVTGYEVYIRKAEESGLLQYWNVIDAPPGTPVNEYWATVVVKRKDRPTEQSWTVDYSEAVQRTKNGNVNKFWKDRPKFMTKKAAIGQGFRLFFEDVLHGIPYTAAEMPEVEDMQNVTPDFQQPQEQVVRESYKKPETTEAKPLSQRMEIIEDGPTYEAPAKSIDDIKKDIIRHLNNNNNIPPIRKGKIASVVSTSKDIEEIKELLGSIEKEFGNGKN